MSLRTIDSICHFLSVRDIFPWTLTVLLSSLSSSGEYCRRVRIRTSFFLLELSETKSLHNVWTTFTLRFVVVFYLLLSSSIFPLPDFVLFMFLFVSDPLVCRFCYDRLCIVYMTFTGRGPKCHQSVGSPWGVRRWPSLTKYTWRVRTSFSDLKGEGQFVPSHW